MNTELKEEIKNYIEKGIKKELDKYHKIYTSEELLTKSEFLEAIKMIQQRFEAVDKRFEELIKSMNKRFEAVDKRFEAADKRFEELINEIKELKVQTGTIGDREGKDFEKTILEILRASIKKRFISLEKVKKLRVKDTEGDIVLPDQRVELDIYASDGRKILMEVKFHMNTEKLVNFYKKAEFIEKIKGFKAEKLVIAIEIDEDALELAKDLGIGVITKHFSF
ncbi:MAG: DUF3782 domain-containing protein [Candidatus Lokiarchaeota archaeon]|nr:DUF3782 domain-containing protein [Candidatus Lokiarchaeota archaeon]